METDAINKSRRVSQANFGGKKKSRRSRQRKYYRLLPVLITGVLITLFFLLLGVLAFCLIAFFGKLDIEQSTKGPLVLLLLSVFLGSLLSSLIIRGKSPLPSSLLGLIFFGVSCFQSLNALPDDAAFSISGLFMKLLLLAVAALGGYALAWFLALPARRKEQQRREARRARLSS